MSLSIATRTNIARAYLAGCKPSDLAAEYGIKPAHIALIAKRYDADRYQARKRGTGGRPARIITAPPLAPERIGDTYVVEHEGMRISLPFVSILRAR